MEIDLSKKSFSTEEIEIICLSLEAAYELGYIEERTESNSYLLASYKGIENMGISPKWNIKIFTYSKKKQGHSIVCVDMEVLKQFLNNNYSYFSPPDLKLLKIDDAGWGFPLGGVMVGVTDEITIKTEVVPVEYFRGNIKFNSKAYLKKYSQLGIKLVNEFDATPKTHRIEICSGFVNVKLRNNLRKLGFDTRIVEIKGMLQDKLEELFKQYIKKETGSDIYYDPKDMNKEDIPKKYDEAVEFALEHCPEIIKTGWRSLSNIK